MYSAAKSELGWLDRGAHLRINSEFNIAALGRFPDYGVILA
jgi:hypothetical protein